MKAFWTIYRLIRKLKPETRNYIIDAIKAVRCGNKSQAVDLVKEAAEREAMFAAGRKFLDG